VQWAIERFVDTYGVDLSVAIETNPANYPSFNAFFTRALRTGTRPLQGDAHTVISPVDGTISQIGRIINDRIIQAKGRHFSAHELLGGISESAAFCHGEFATIYLSPKDYHRIHMPIKGTLRQMIHVPGQLFSVNTATAQKIPNLFARNERVACLFDTELGPMAVVLVGALNVGSIETVWAGEVTPPTAQNIQYSHYYDQEITLNRGDELGHFNMGSTVILLFSENRITWDAQHQIGLSLKMGQTLGTAHHPD